MSSNTTNAGFFEWFVGLFKKSEPLIVKPTPAELAKKKEQDEIRAKYSLEFIESYNCYFVRYFWRNQWWYLRRWDEDYTLERVKGNAIRISEKEHLDQIIYLHQDWIKDGHIFLNYE
jgi:hypothetical protein